MLHLVRRYNRLIVIWGVIGALIINGIALFFPKQYSAESKVLIISRDRTGVDPYTQAKSAERIGENLARVMETSDFFNKVMASNVVTFDKEPWKDLNERDQRRKWEKDVNPQVIYNTSLLRITAYSYSKEEVVRFLNAITQTLTSRGWEYIGGDVILKQVDDPLVSRFMARPNLLVNTVAGFVLGVALCTVWVLYYKKHAIFGS